MRGDAVSAQLALTHDEGDEALAVLQRAVVSLQEITLRLDEEALEAVAAAMQGVMDVPAVGSHDDATSAAGVGGGRRADAPPPALLAAIGGRPRVVLAKRAAHLKAPQVHDGRARRRAAGRACRS